MTHPLRLLVVVATAAVLALAGCGGDNTDDSSSAPMRPLADAFADQLALDAGFPWFQALERADTECFATTVLDTIGEQRQTALRFAVDNIPLLFEADWTDTELDALTEILDTCVNDTTTGTEAYVLSVYGRLDQYGDCIASEVTTTLGERYWLEALRSDFTPPRIEAVLTEEHREAELAGEEPPPPSSFTELEPIFETCAVPGLSDSGGPIDYAEDACGGEPCEDAPEPSDLRSVVLECSRDPYVDASFYAGVEELDETLRFRINCEDQGRGTLISVRLLAYPCPDGPRGIELAATGEPITEATVTDACASSPPAESATPTVDSDLPSLDEPWDAEAFTSPVASWEAVQLRRRTSELFEGLLLLVDLELRFDDGGQGGTTTALRVTNGHPELIVGRWCNSPYSPALDAFDGSVLFDGDSLVVCTPGERYRSTQWQKLLATARIGQDRLALVIGREGLDYVDLDTLESRTILELDPQEDGVPLSASYGADRWVVVLSTPDDDPADPASESRRHIVFLDSVGEVVDVPNNPFPDPDTDAPRAAALSDDGETLVFSAEHDDGSSTLVYSDLQTGAETNRIFIIEPQPDDEPDDPGRQWVSSIDISGDQILVNLAASNGESHPSRALLIDFDGNQEDLYDVDVDAHVRAAAFLAS